MGKVIKCAYITIGWLLLAIASRHSCACSHLSLSHTHNRIIHAFSNILLLLYFIHYTVLYIPHCSCVCYSSEQINIHTEWTTANVGWRMAIVYAPTSIFIYHNALLRGLWIFDIAAQTQTDDNTIKRHQLDSNTRTAPSKSERKKKYIKKYIFEWCYYFDILRHTHI